MNSNFNYTLLYLNCVHVQSSQIKYFVFSPVSVQYVSILVKSRESIFQQTCNTLFQSHVYCLNWQVHWLACKTKVILYNGQNFSVK